MSPVLDQIQEKVYERPIPYTPILGHSGPNRELLTNQSKYPWAWNVVLVGLLKRVK